MEPSIKNPRLVIIISTSVFLIALISSVSIFFYLQNRERNITEQNNTTNSEINNDENLPIENTPNNPWQNGCSVEERVQMQNSPMDLSDFSYIIPLGTYAGAHVTPIDHLYFSPADFNSPRDQYPVYAMADGDIIEIGVRRINVDKGNERPPEYRIIFQHSCQTISYFDLVTSLDQSILDQVPSLENSDYSGHIRIPVKAGQIIGRIGGQTLDTAVYNMDLYLTGFISPELYESEPWKIHTDDFFSYFDEPLKSTLLAKNLRIAEPRSGKIDYDIPGKLVGNWFKEGTNGYAGLQQNGMGTNGYWSGHLSVTYDAIRPQYIIVSLGNFNGEPKQFYVKGNSPDPALVSSDTGVVKYDLIDTAHYMNWADINQPVIESSVFGVVLFEVQGEQERLKVEIFPGQTSSQVKGFTENAMFYER